MTIYDTCEQAEAAALEDVDVEALKRDMFHENRAAIEAGLRTVSTVVMMAIIPRNECWYRGEDGPMPYMGPLLRFTAEDVRRYSEEAS